MDIGKGLLSIFLTRLATDFVPLWFIVGLAVVIGHCWSVFLRFRGGMGATVMAGVLCGLIFWPWFVAGLITGIIVMILTKKSGLSSAVIILVSSLFLFLYPLNYSVLVGFYPLLFGTVMLFKRYQKERALKSGNHALR
jgi:glycerol-3-phosphate acyltransferase PlsY